MFDFDGTLAVQTLDFVLMRTRAMEALAPFLPQAALPAKPTSPMMEELERLLSPLPAQTAATARKAALNAARAVEIEAAQTAGLFAFTRPMLAALKAAGAKAGVVTRNCPEAVLTVFPDVAEYCGVVLTRDDVPLVKPHPDHLLRALDALGAPAGKALMVGDHPMDIAAGKAAGMATGGVAGGGTPLAGLAETGADFLADDAGRLLRDLGLRF